MKRALTIGTAPCADADALDLAQEAALSLLCRSVSFGHGRLAVIRLAIAVDTGAVVPGAVFDYCRDAAVRSKDLALLATFAAAEAKRKPALSSVVEEH